jgi:magnesium-transporting ATPase (P-type)
VLQLYPFNSERKRMSTIVRHRDGNQRIYTKGASEIVLEYCTRYLNVRGPHMRHRGIGPVLTWTVWTWLSEKRRCRAHD